MIVKEKQLKILLVEDNPDDVLLIKFALNKENVLNEMFIAKDGEEAEEFLNKKGTFTQMPTPELIILDLNLPKKDGFSVLKTIKSNQELKMLPVIVLTTSTNPDDIHRCYSEYANCYIKKPSDLQEFLKIIRNIKALWLDTAILPSLN